MMEFVSGSIIKNYHDDEIIVKPKNSKEYRLYEKQQKFIFYRDLDRHIEDVKKKHGLSIDGFDALFLEKARDTFQAPLPDQERNQKENIAYGGYVANNDVTHAVMCFYVKATLKTGEIIDPCIVTTHHVDPYWSSLNQYNIYAGGQIKHLEPSQYLLPHAVRCAARDTVFEYRMGAWTPLMISIEGKQNYILQAFSSLARWGDYYGCDVDPNIYDVVDISKPPTRNQKFQDDIEINLILTDSI